MAPTYDITKECPSALTPIAARTPWKAGQHSAGSQAHGDAAAKTEHVCTFANPGCKTGSSWPFKNSHFMATISQQLVRRRRGQLADDLQLICVRRLCMRWRRLQRREDCRHLAALRRHLERLRLNVRHLQPSLYMDPALAIMLSCHLHQPNLTTHMPAASQRRHACGRWTTVKLGVRVFAHFAPLLAPQ